jgi:hypothetical protein
MPRPLVLDLVDLRSIPTPLRQVLRGYANSPGKRLITPREQCALLAIGGTPETPLDSVFGNPRALMPWS